MKQGALDRSRFETIEAYLLGTMPAADRTGFEAEMADDADLREEVRLQMENTLAIELGGVSRLLRTITAEQPLDFKDHGAERIGWKRYLKYAAVVAIVVSGSFWMLMRPSVGERLYAEHYIVDPGLPTPMSATDDPAFADAMVSYKEGQYAEARAKWSPLLQMEPTNDTLRYYIASAWLAAGDASSAVPLLAGLADEPASAFHARSRWFLFLACVRTGDFDRAKAIDLDADPQYGDLVRSIKARLP